MLQFGVQNNKGGMPTMGTLPYKVKKCMSIYY